MRHGSPTAPRQPSGSSATSPPARALPSAHRPLEPNLAGASAIAKHWYELLTSQ